MVPAEVTRELVAGIPEHPALARTVSLRWLEIVELIEIDEVVAFARYKAEFGGGRDRNNGEAAVLAYASAHSGVAVVDERVATRAAKRDGLEVHGTLWLIANGVRSGALTRGTAEQMVDNLVATGMKLPVDGATFFTWANAEGLLP